MDIYYYNTCFFRRRFVHLFLFPQQEKTFGTGKIYTFIADKPEGPWYNKKLIYKINERKNIFTYNAMAHPQFKKDGMILISYNVNVEDFVEQHKDVSTYRPRFIWIDISKIVEK